MDEQIEGLKEKLTEKEKECETEHQENKDLNEKVSCYQENEVELKKCLEEVKTTLENTQAELDEKTTVCEKKNRRVKRCSFSTGETRIRVSRL